MMEYMGIEPDRFQMSWVSASEGSKFADVVKTTVEKVRKLGPNTKFQSKDEKEGGE
jgi:coenzyme F420-reducing hydrogenase delta subunit